MTLILIGFGIAIGTLLESYAGAAGAFGHGRLDAVLYRLAYAQLAAASALAVVGLALEVAA